MSESVGRKIARARAWLVENEGYDPTVIGDRLDDEARSHAAFADAELAQERDAGWQTQVTQILRDCKIVQELRKLGRFDSAEKLEKLLPAPPACGS